jgi:hypothetical protein
MKSASWTQRNGGRIPARLPMIFKTGCHAGGGDLLKTKRRAPYSAKKQSHQPPAFEQETWFKELTTEHPIQAAILARLLQRFLGCLGKGISPEEIVARLAAAGSEISELASYLLEPKVKLPIAERKAEAADEANAWAAAYIRAGRGEIAQIATMVQDVLLRNPRGRPVDNHISAVKAYELLLATPTLRWQEIADKVCDCPKNKHDKTCKERVRISVITLEGIVKKYGIQAPPLPKR